MGGGEAAARESQEPNRQPDAWLGARGTHLPFPTAGLKCHRREGVLHTCLASAPAHGWSEEGTDLLAE